MSNNQSALWMGRDRREIIEQVVGMREDDRSNPGLAIIVSGVINPNRTQRSMEGALTRACEQPDASITVANDPTKVVINIGRTRLGFLAGSAGRHFRFRAIDG